MILSRNATTDPQTSVQPTFQLVASLLDALDRPLLVSDRSGKVLFTNLHARDALNTEELNAKPELNLFRDILRADHKSILRQLADGQQEISLLTECPEGKRRSRVRWLP